MLLPLKFQFYSPDFFLMDSSNTLEIKGSLRTVPLAELLCEIADHKFNGSLRLAHEAYKIVVYFDAGKIVFIVSNARQHRLFEQFLQTEKFTKEQLASIKDFTNDLALRENLLKDNLIDESEMDLLFSHLLSEILKLALSWHDGEWTFSPLVRIKNSIRFQFNANSVLIETARELFAAEAARKFKNPLESLIVKSPIPQNINLSPHESFVFSRFETAALTVEEIQSFSGLPEPETFQILYALWLGGFITRLNRHMAFSEKEIAAIQSARLTVKKEEAKPSILPSADMKISASEKPEANKLSGSSEKDKSAEESESAQKELTLENYLSQIERATNFYEVFALATDSDAAEIKKTYFSLARRFHPDLFHKETDAKLLQRIQNAFSELARAYETLKHESSREVYDFKIRKELAEAKERTEAGETGEAGEKTTEVNNLQKQSEQAVLNFEQGFDYLMDENPSAAEPFLARAVHFDKTNARYHAYYGKALAADQKQRHKAESELQTAIKLDGNNPDYRIMLAEFFNQIGLRKRAEGELNRLLTIFPNHREAQTLLDSLLKK